MRKAKGEAEKLKNQLARALADYDNLRKRTEAEREIWAKFSAEEVLIKLLPTLDIFESAQKHLNDHGLGLAIGEFKKVLLEEGLVEIKLKEGDSFDPKVHEAVESVSGGKRGKVSELVLAGWRFEDGKVIRPAKVKVYGEKSKKEEELEKEMLRGDYV
ncbi:nucleotide exchange factor GrpE [Candidatus Woesebacteria bacterium]|nr:nucleotide exchange factor GrpE [Candidatus Woesebacteria bacterium]